MPHYRSQGIETIEEEARKLGISYGTYIGYRDTGYLETYKRIKENEEKERSEMSHVYVSHIGGGKDKTKGTVSHHYSKDKKK